MKPRQGSAEHETQHRSVVGDLAAIVDMARASAGRSVNGVMNAAYWLIGRQLRSARAFDRMVGTRSQARRSHAAFGKPEASARKRIRNGKVSVRLQEFYQQWPYERSRQGDSRGSSSLNDPEFFAWVDNRVRGRDGPEAAATESMAALAARFPLPWSAYMRLLAVEDESAREFYENQAIHGGWSVRELDPQIISLLYDRTRSGGGGALTDGSPSSAEVEVAPNHAVKDPSVLAFLDLDGGNSESDEREWGRPRPRSPAWAIC